jgi:xylulokinase
VGAALLAGLGVGLFATPQAAVDSPRYNSAIVAPDPARVEWYARLYEEAYRPLYSGLRGTHHALGRIAAGQSVKERNDCG